MTKLNKHRSILLLISSVIQYWSLSVVIGLIYYNPVRLDFILCVLAIMLFIEAQTRQSMMSWYRKQWWRSIDPPSKFRWYDMFIVVRIYRSTKVTTDYKY